MERNIIMKEENNIVKKKKIMIIWNVIMNNGVKIMKW